MKMDQESRLWRLNPYELSREPHHISPNDPRVIHTTRSLLETELQCAICLDILRNTRTTKECLHRFCDDCISQFLRSGERKCPNCRTKLVSMRSLRPDPLFDNIIKTIFPHRQEMDQQQAALLAKIDKNPTVRRGRGRPHGSVPGTSRAETVQNDLESDDAPLVCIKLRPYVKKIRTEGHEGLLKKWEPAKRYIKVKGTAKVDHLCRFILTRLIVERHCNPTVDISSVDVKKVLVYVHMGRSSEDYHLVPHNLTLIQVHQEFWNIQRPMCLFFAFDGNIKLK